MKSGLVRMAIFPFTDREWDDLTHVCLTDEQTWDPLVLDYEHNLEGDAWYDANESTMGESALDLFTSRGDNKFHVAAQFHESLTCDTSGSLASTIDYCIFHAQHSQLDPSTLTEAYNFSLVHQEVVNRQDCYLWL